MTILSDEAGKKLVISKPIGIRDDCHQSYAALLLGNIMDRFNPGRLGDWVIFCDICGQKCYASESTKLTTYTGKGGNIVCQHDVDEVDKGLIPFNVNVEQNIPWTRVNHTDTTNSTAPYVDTTIL